MRLATVLGVLLLASGCALPGRPVARPTPSPPSGKPGRVLVVPVTQLPPQAGTPCRASLTSGVGCGDKGERYRFEPAAVQTLRLTHVYAERPAQTTAYAIELVTDHAGTAAMASLTQQAAASRGQLGLLDPQGRMLSAPTVQAPITEGRLQIAGDYSRAQAERVVSLLTQNPS